MDDIKGFTKHCPKCKEEGRLVELKTVKVNCPEFGKDDLKYCENCGNYYQVKNGKK